MQNELDTLRSKNVDIHGRRVINASHAIHDHDYIIKRQLDEALAALQEEAEVDEGLGNVTVNFTPSRDNYGIVTLNEIKFIDLQTGALVPSIGKVISGLHVILAAVDENTTYVQRRVAFGTDEIADPAIISVGETLCSEGTFRDGDYILFNNNNPSPVPGLRSFEIGKILSGASSNQWTVERTPLDVLADTRRSYFGTAKSAQGSGINIYKVNLYNFEFSFRQDLWSTNELTLSGYPDKVEMVIPNRCVVGIAAAVYNRSGFGSWTNFPVGSKTNEAQSWELNGHPTPGIRTLNGAAYYIPAAGTLTEGKLSDFKLPVYDLSPYRVIYGYVQTPPIADTSDSALKVNVKYRTFVGIAESGEFIFDEVTIETIEWPSNSLFSWLGSEGEPRLRQTPYNPEQTLVCEPTDSKWPNYLLVPDGELYFEIETVGDIQAGADLMVVVGT